MPMFPIRLFRSLLTAWLLLSGPVLSLGDVEVPPSVLNPKTPTEAWNVIRLATANIERLFAENRITEIPIQISLCSPALRALPAGATTPEDAEAIRKDTTRAIGWIVAIARTAGENNLTATTDGFRTFQAILDELRKRYDPDVHTAELYACPMHPEYIAPIATQPCGKCGMKLFQRRIPYSFIYTVPGEPNVKLTALPNGPIEAGKPVEVKVRLSRRDGAPVPTSDLMVVHGEPIHLLIQNPSLSDYHHEHPVPTSTPGEYTFTFTPLKNTPYRIWADIVPHESGLQELPYVDLPSPGQPASIEDRDSRFTSTADGYQFALSLSGGNHLPIKAGETRTMGITVTDVNGQPVKTLEPVMQAFAHLVGFYGDYQTVVHLHPTGGDILNPEARGGPALAFKFFAPKEGFIRLYCQVKIDGKILFAPFNINVGS